MAFAVEQELKTHAEWIQARKTMIGASESPIILGYGFKGESPYSLWAKKCGFLNDEDGEVEAFEWGHAIQPIALGMFARKTGIRVVDPGPYTIRRHPTLRWFGCTLDGLAITDEGDAVVEAKNVGGYMSREWDDDNPPLRVNIQMQHQMAVTGTRFGYAVACIGGNRLEWKRVERNNLFIEALIEELSDFWELVETQTPPAVDGSEATYKAISAMHPDDNGKTIALPAESDMWCEELAKVKEHIKNLESSEREIGNQIREAIGDCTYGMTPSGAMFSYKTQESAGYYVGPKKYRVLRRDAAKKKKKK